MADAIPAVKEVLIRPAEEADFRAITSIYGASVVAEAASFETSSPDVAEMTRRWQTIAAAHCPYLVAEADAGRHIAGYAYARPFHERAAYRWTLENSVYVDPAFKGQRVGSLLLARLIEDCAKAGFRQMIAVISSDASPASVALHKSHGFREAGRLVQVGYKLGRWHDVIYMQRALAADDAPPYEG